MYDSTHDSWTLSPTAAQFALITTKPNNIRGNTVIYGHNTQAVLAPMKDIAVGDIVSVKTTNGHTFNYTYSHDKIVDPSFTEVFSENPDTPQLTLLTCDGIWSTVRRLMYFDFQNVT
jgi:LPXTG-site transpeptidase (sortase) family protein